MNRLVLRPSAYGERPGRHATKVRSGAVGARVDVRDHDDLGARWVYRSEVVAHRRVKVGAIACGEGDATLSRAVRWHCEDRVIQYGNQTVVL